MIKVFYTAACMLVFSQAIAQVPGYMGKRLSVGGRLNFSPIINEYNVSPNSTEIDLLYFSYMGLNKRFEFHSDYVLNKRKSAGGSVAFHNPGFMEGYKIHDSLMYSYAFVNMKSTKIGAYLSWGKKDGVPAPVGRFFRWELAMYFFKASNDIPQMGFKPGFVPATFITFGRNYVVKDAVLLNWGLQYGLTLLRFWDLPHWYDHKKPKSHTHRPMKQASEKERLLESNAFNLEVGVGFLLK